MSRRSALAAWETRRRRAVVAHALRAARAAISRANRRGLPVDTGWMLTVADQIAARGYACAVTGKTFDVAYRTAGAGGTHLAPSPDRIVPDLGYVRGNVRWVLWAVNRAKGEMPDDLFVDICTAVATRAGMQERSN
jgi:hypothetical protein